MVVRFVARKNGLRVNGAAMIEEGECSASPDGENQGEVVGAEVLGPREGVKREEVMKKMGF